MDGPILLFDGTCALCSGLVHRILARDHRGVFRFAALASEAAARVLEEAGYREELPDSVVLLRNGQVFLLSDAAIEIGRELGFPWSLARAAGIVPRGLRNALYRWVARNRYRWFGRKESPAMPPPGLRERFLDAAEPR